MDLIVCGKGSLLIDVVTAMIAIAIVILPSFHAGEIGREKDGSWISVVLHDMKKVFNT